MGLVTRFRSSLTNPIAATLVLVTVVPVVVVGYLLASHNRENLTDNEKRVLGSQALGLASDISKIFDRHRTDLRSTARALAAAEQPELKATEALLGSIGSEPNRSFVYLRILDAQGRGTFVRAPNVTPETDKLFLEVLQHAHREALRGIEVQYFNVDLPQPNVAASVFGYPLRDKDGVIWGTLQGVLDLTVIERPLRDEQYSGRLVSVIDATGKVVVSSDPARRGTSLSASPLVQDFLKNPSLRLTRVYASSVAGDKVPMVGSVAPIAELQWGVVAERPMAEAFATVRGMQQRTLLVTAIAAVCALGIGFGLSQRLVKPLQKLAHITSEIAEGNLAVRSDVAGHDEIARLAANFNNMAGNIEALVRRLKQALRQNQELFLETIRTLAAAIDAKDPYTRGHSERVSSYSMAIARHLGLDQEEVFRIRIAAILHDVGKLGIRDGILNKPGILTDEEFAVMRRHPDIGGQIMSPIRMLRDVIPGIRNHHESWDGRGYPDRLHADQIPLVARIIGVADTFDAMTTNRPYQDGMSLDVALEKMRSLANARFDPKVIDAFLAAIRAGDITPPDNKKMASAAS